MMKYINVLAHRSYVRRVMSKLPVANTPIPAQRLHLEKITKNATIPSTVSVSDTTLQLAGQPSINAEWITPADVNNNQVLLYFHGGGFIVGSKETHRPMVAHIAKSANTQTLSINYRLAPEHTYPAAHQDCFNAYRWLLNNGYDSQKIILGGDSAGAFFVLQTLLEIKRQGIDQPQAAFLLSPLADALHFNGESYVSKRKRDPWLKADQLPDLVDLYLGNSTDIPSSLSPINSDLFGFPPILTHVGEDEILLSDSLRLHQQLQAHGVSSELIVWPKMWHVFHCMGGKLPQAKQAISQIGDFIKNLPQYA